MLRRAARQYLLRNVQGFDRREAMSGGRFRGRNQHKVVKGANGAA